MYQVFDGKSFIPYSYPKAVAVKLAKERATLYQRATQVWKNTKQGLVVEATYQPC